MAETRRGQRCLVPSICTTEVCRKVGKFMLKYKDAKPELMHTVVRDGYNVIYRLEFKNLVDNEGSNKGIICFCGICIGYS